MESSHKNAHRWIMALKNKFVGVRFSEEEVEWLQAIAPDGNVSRYIRDTVLRMSQSDRKLVNMDDRIIDIGHDMKRVTDLILDLGKTLRMQQKALNQISQGSDEIPEELVGMVLEMLLLIRSFSNPQDRRMAQADVAQIGLPIWRKK